jgi:uncharacterized protein DUF4325
MSEIVVAKDFSTRPAGRYHPRDGDATGQKFRDQLLVPKLRSEDGKVVVDLSGLRLLTSSFLEEVFGGLIRLGFTRKELQDKLEVRMTGPHGDEYKSEIDDIIEQAEKRKSN